jgi:hypothetical protein
MEHEVISTGTAWPPEMQNRLLELIFEMSYRDIASILNAEFGVTLSRSSIAGKALRMNLVKHRMLPRAPAVPLPPALPPALLPGQFRLLELPPGGCKWPVEYADGVHLFCGAQQLELRPYCKAHEKLAYVRSRPPRMVDDDQHQTGANKMPVRV